MGEDNKNIYAKGMTAGTYKHEFAKAHYDRIALNIPKGRKEAWKAAASAAGLSLSEYVIKRVERDA